MSRLIDITGHKFGRLTVLNMGGVDKRGLVTWACACDCGSKSFITTGARLREGKTKSCGCLRRESMRQKATARMVGNIPMSNSERWKRNREVLSDGYIRSLIARKKTKLSHNDIPDELVMLKRESLRNKRVLRQINEEIRRHTEVSK